MRTPLVSLVGVVLLAGSAGCSTSDIVRSEPPAGYVQDAAARVAAADWSAPEAVTVTLSEYHIEPAMLTFRTGVATRLTVRNVGDQTHTFVSEGFFKAIAARKLVSADGETATPYLERIEVRPGEARRLDFVPVAAGTYALECSVPFHDVFGMEGRITIR